MTERGVEPVGAGVVKGLSEDRRNKLCRCFFDYEKPPEPKGVGGFFCGWEKFS